MELPVFQENLRSSASWLTDLEKEGVAWRSASPEALERARILQIHEASQRAESPDGEWIARFTSAANLVSNWATAEGKVLDTTSLAELHRVLSATDNGSGAFRAGEASRLGPYHDPAPAVLLPRLVDNALDWFQTQSFSEIHAVEQASIAYLRILDLQPFESLNNEVACLTAGFYTQRAGLPGIVLFSDRQAEYEASLEAAFRMLTQPLVEFLATSLVRTMRLALA